MTQVFFILNELMDSYKVSVITYNFLLIIETLQILFFAYQNNLPYMWDNQVVRYSLEVLNYIQVAGPHPVRKDPRFNRQFDQDGDLLHHAR